MNDNNMEVCTECEEMVAETAMIDDRDADKYMCTECAIVEVSRS